MCQQAQSCLCFIEKVHAMEKENEIQTANEVKVSSSHTFKTFSV